MMTSGIAGVDGSNRGGGQASKLATQFQGRTQDTMMSCQDCVSLCWLVEADAAPNTEMQYPKNHSLARVQRAANYLLPGDAKNR